MFFVNAIVILGVPLSTFIKRLVEVKEKKKRLYSFLEEDFLSEEKKSSEHCENRICNCNSKT